MLLTLIKILPKRVGVMSVSPFDRRGVPGPLTVSRVRERSLRSRPFRRISASSKMGTHSKIAWSKPADSPNSALANRAALHRGDRFVSNHSDEGVGGILQRLRTEKSRLRRCLAHLRDLMRRIRHLPLQDQAASLNQVLRGHYAYYGIGGNLRALQRVHRIVERYWYKMLCSRTLEDLRETLAIERLVLTQCGR